MFEIAFLFLNCLAQILLRCGDPGGQGFTFDRPFSFFLIHNEFEAVAPFICHIYIVKNLLGINPQEKIEFTQAVVRSDLLGKL